jgi:hypothetical protein
MKMTLAIFRVAVSFGVLFWTPCGAQSMQKWKTPDGGGLMSEVPSAGGGSLQTSGSRAARETSASAPSSSGSLFIQTNEPWTVVLDAEGNPSAVIVGGAPSRPARSALFGR